MKKILVLLILTLNLATAKSQVIISLLLGDKLNTGKIEFGLEGGYNNSTLSGLPGANGMGGFNLGFYFDIKTKNPSWMFLRRDNRPASSSGKQRKMLQKQ